MKQLFFSFKVAEQMAEVVLELLVEVKAIYRERGYERAVIGELMSCFGEKGYY